MKLLKDAADWLHSRKINQWQFLREGGEDEEIRAGVLSGKTYLARQGREIVGTFTLYSLQSEWDAYIWGERSDDAVYLHRLAVVRDGRGQGIGGKLISWVQDECRNRGNAFLRLDCIARNERLNRYYLHQGFVSLGISRDHSMYQKSLAVAKEG
ncbi:GNAT family N-acetyltransferase [Chelativorans alearense]|uniref:GNAT family N-acetyltransferase n=1 Tax=Chelativorans alearense TaxID=2681495 RepID=UPI0013D06A65|nr:GNAT family N-acetyltransferase [Chelativorans alearense]